MLEQLQGSGISISIATKSDLVLRDLDLIRTFPNARVSWSINTLDDAFRKEMDRGVSIERRLAAMKQFYDAGIQTTCFISPIFPGITDPIEIIEAAKSQCNLVWLENLNLRGDYGARIISWIHEKHPELDELYHEIYSKKRREYWTALDQKMREYTARENMPFTIRQFADDLLCFMTGHRIEKAHLLGFSDGGNIAMVFAMKYPDRVDRLILNGANLNPEGVKRSTQIPIEIGYRIAKKFAEKSDSARLNAEMLGLMVNDPKVKLEELCAIRAKHW